jgi:hypothetical protein
MINSPSIPLSVILKEMAMLTLMRPDLVPTCEAVAAGLLFAHVAWNRANGEDMPDTMYKPILSDMISARPDFWKELISEVPEVNIFQLVSYKLSNYPNDTRHIVSCGLFNQKVRVTFTG